MPRIAALSRWSANAMAAFIAVVLATMIVAF
jgi:hypothetical protein